MNANASAKSAKSRTLDRLITSKSQFGKRVANEAIDANPKLGMGLERAYAQYSLHQSADALAAVQALERTAAAQHLEAQTRYRMGQYDEAAGIYQQLHDGGEDSGDFKAHLLASFAASGVPHGQPISVFSM